MSREKVRLIVKGYILREKRRSFLICAFLCFVTVFLLVCNQLFVNVETANQWNAEALEGKYHVLYPDISEEAFRKIQECPFVEETGRHFFLGQAQDGTYFTYIDEGFRDLSASVADKNIKRTVEGQWAEKENEVVFTENYMERYNLRLRDTVCVDLSAADAATGDVLYRIPELTLTVTGIVDNEVGFADHKNGYVSEALADSVRKERGGTSLVTVKFGRQDKISEDFQKLNEYLGYGEEEPEALAARKNAMLAEAVEEGGNLKKQNRLMNFIVWLVCVLVVYNIFYNRFFEKKKDFIYLRKMGFQTEDLLKITGTEFFVFILTGFTTGMLAGFWINKWICLKLMKVMVDAYGAQSPVSSDLSWQSVRNTVFMLVLITIPCLATAGYQLKKTVPVRLMASKRKNRRKYILAFLILSLSAVLISLLAIQDNHSDEGILSVKTYVPGDIQLTKGSVFENMMDSVIPAISDQALRQIEALPDVEQVQSYEINYSRAVFLCEEETALNRDSPYYEMLSEMKQNIDGKEQCLYNLILVATDNMEALVPSWDESGGGAVAVMEGELAHVLNLKNGDHFTVYDEALIGSGSKKDCAGAEIMVLDTMNIVLSESHIGGNMLIVDQETAKLFPGGLSRQVVNIWAKEGRETAAAAEVRRIAEKEGCLFHSAGEQMEAYTDSDRTQRTMKGFFILILAFTGALIYFNTVFVNLLNRKSDFILMHRIGIRRSEMYRMVLKEAAGQSLLAWGVIGGVQAALCVSRKILFPVAFIAVDVGVLFVCILFPCVALYCNSIRENR